MQKRNAELAQAERKTVMDDYRSAAGREPVGTEAQAIAICSASWGNVGSGELLLPGAPRTAELPSVARWVQPRYFRV